MNIFVSGGAGYIGAHTCVTLLEKGHSVIISDDLRNSNEDVLKKVLNITGGNITFYRNDVTNSEFVEDIFGNHKIDAVIHFAGLKAVAESSEKPLAYYYNNIVSTIVLAEACLKYKVNKFVFSSSATVYGENEVPFKETMDLFLTTNPYGETKVISERVLKDFSKANPCLSISILRYFNPVGAHESGLIGESPNGKPNNLMPYITQVANGKLEKLKIFGNDYPTIDGTGVRDYIHVMDLAEGHLAALNNIKQGTNIYNLGTGKGTSVLELVNAFEEANNVNIPYEITSRRPGDLAQAYADPSKANKELMWEAKRDLLSMCRDAWRFEKNNKTR